MILRRAILCATLLLSSAGSVPAQPTRFCESVEAILGDAPNRFRNVKGKKTKDDMTATIWQCTIPMPGTIASRFVSSQGHYYEGALIQTPKKTELLMVYKRYKTMLKECLEPMGYQMSLQDNFYYDLKDYKKVVFMKPMDTPPPNGVFPPHVSMEAMYEKDLKTYTIVLYIFDK